MQYTSAFSGYSIDDLERAKTFYGNTLGLTVEQTPEGLSVKTQGAGNVFLYPKPNHTPASFTVLNFVVADIEAAVQELKDGGVTLENYDMGPMKADEHGIYRGKAAGQGPDIAWFKDPAGNILSVIQE